VEPDVLKASRGATKPPGDTCVKTVSESRDYVDFTHGNSGVRVWKNQCQVISRQDETCDWIGQGDIVPIPVPDSILGFPHSGTPPTTALASEVAGYDDKESNPELRGLLKRWMEFEDALSTK
jgi:hypothetical protein